MTSVADDRVSMMERRGSRISLASMDEDYINNIPKYDHHFTCFELLIKLLDGFVNFIKSCYKCECFSVDIDYFYIKEYVGWILDSASISITVRLHYCAV